MNGRGPSFDGYAAREIDATTTRGAHTEREASFDLELVVMRGADAGARCSLSPGHPGPILIGQSATCDLQLRDRSVSRRHAAFDASSWPVRVTDLGSTNGTYVNGVSIQEAHLVGGESVQVGDTELSVARRPSAPRERLDDRRSFGRTLGASAAMRRLYPLCEDLAASDAPVLIEGEAGTGKELLAESLHECGPWAQGPFVVLDCATRAGDLLRRQRERGDAFEALLAEAVNGTLLVDEVGDLEPALQRAFVRALSAIPRTTQARFRPARVLVATRKNLDWLVQHGRFREDLYAFVSATRIELPPLRARHGDVRLLAAHFWRQGGGAPHAFPADVIARVESQPWPGNVRELRDYVVGLIAGEAPQGPRESAGAARDASELSELVVDVLRADLPYAEARRRLVSAFEQSYVERMLDLHQGNVTRAAAACGLARRNFQLIRARRSGSAER
jgi:DNA-binding NtrC family response regulator